MTEPMLFRQRVPFTFKAMQFTGGSKNAQTIIDWMISLGYQASWKAGSYKKNPW